MPDWSYRTVFQPMLFMFSATTARDLALGAMGRLSRMPLGSAIIDLFGHMRPDKRLEQTIGGTVFPSPQGIGCFVDPHGVATQAMARFGVGFIEVGPIAATRLSADKPIDRRASSRDLWIPAGAVADSVDIWQERLGRPCPAARRLARLVVAAGTSPAQAGAECVNLLARLSPLVEGFVIATADEGLKARWAASDWEQYWRSLLDTPEIRPSPGRLWLALRADLTDTERSLIASAAISAGCRNVLIEGRIADPQGGFLIGHSALPKVRESVSALREQCGADVSLMAGGVHDPAEALELRRLGATTFLIDSGLVYSGPGLPKRLNEAVLYQEFGDQDPLPSALPIQKLTWFWTFVLGLAMLLGGFLALAIASTRVILPYDEVFVGMSREDLNLINPRLLDFMKHDRVTLAGTMLAVAVLYLFLTWKGIRKGIHWAMVSVLVSAFVGFLSFFFFLGFGYFDPFHAFITAVLFQFLLLAWQGDLGPSRFTLQPNLRETAAWRLAQWGQLLFIIHGAVLIGAGTVISAYGCTSVFVREDLEFMDVCPTDLSLANPRLIPLIAHDRASFGGMLIATGMAVLLSTLWGIREGARWQWWMLLLAGLPAYGIAIGVHLVVGYTSWWHLAPAYGGLVLLVVALVLLRPYLCGSQSAMQSEWTNFRR